VKLTFLSKLKATISKCIVAFFVSLYRQSSQYWRYTTYESK